MNIKSLLFLSAFIISPFIYSQSVELPVDYVRRKNQVENPNPEVVQGSKYLNENFQNGKVIFNNKEVNTQLRYNLLIDEFELKSNTDQEVVSIVPIKDIRIEIGSTDFALQSYIDQNEKIAIRYFEILNRGPIQLMKRNVVEYNEAEPAVNSYSQDKPAEYVASADFYLSKGDQPAEKLRRLRKKYVLNFIDADEAKKYVKENKLKLKSEEEIIELLDFLNNSK